MVDISKIFSKKNFTSKCKNFHPSCMDDLAIAYCRIDHDGRLSYVNKEWLKIYGYENAEKIIGDRASEFISDFSEYQNILDGMAEQAPKVRPAPPLRALNGINKHSISHIRPLLDKGKTVIGVEAFTFNAGPLFEKIQLDLGNKLKTQLLHIEKLASVGTLAAGVAHEINNPLQIILGYLEVLEQKTAHLAGAESVTHELTTLTEAAERVRNIVDGLRTYARTDVGNIEEIDVHSAINSTLRLISNILKNNNVTVVKDFRAHHFSGEIFLTGGSLIRQIARKHTALCYLDLVLPL